jgi:hypothetical protein
MRATKRDTEEQATPFASIKGKVGIALLFEEFRNSHFHSQSLGTNRPLTYNRPSF